MMLNNIRSILLFGTESSIALPVIRTLGSALPEDVLIHSLSFNKGLSQIPTFSKYLHSHYYLQSTNEEELYHELLDRIVETGANVMLPVDEPYVRMLSALKHRLEKYICLPPLPESTLFDSLVNKYRLSQLLQNHSFRGAITHSLNELNITRLNDGFFPCMLKPVRGSSGQGMKKINNRNELAGSIKSVDGSDYIIQEFIPGQDIDCSLLAIEGDIKAFTIQKGLENKGFNFPTAIKFENNAAVFKSVQKLINLTGYSGLAHLDFRLDERDGLPKLIDFNARFWCSLLGSKAAGVDFVYLSCLASMGIPFEKPRFRENTYLMGSSTFNHYRRKVLNFYSNSAINHIHTDLWHRINDPLPEIVRYTSSLLQPKKNKEERQLLYLTGS